jgi:hypothetical protein
MSKASAPSAKESQVVPDRPECFVIMPISDPEGYQAGHFRRVFEDVFVPACDKAGFRAIRGDQVRATNLIHLDILQRLLSTPIALCDLSSRNPNVLFELGLRQAFDKPVVLVQESGTPPIFDIAPLRYTEYRRARLYDEVLQDQIRIADAISETIEAFGKNEGVNSLVKIMSLTRSASLSDVQAAEADPSLQLIRAELSALRTEIQRSRGYDRASRVNRQDQSILIASPEEREMIGIQILGYLTGKAQPTLMSEITSALDLRRIVGLRVLNYLEEAGFVTRATTPEGNFMFEITEPGHDYLEFID